MTVTAHRAGRLVGLVGYSRFAAPSPYVPPCSTQTAERTEAEEPRIPVKASTEQAALEVAFPAWKVKAPSSTDWAFSSFEILSMCWLVTVADETYKLRVDHCWLLYVV